jgi:hypothetical protein
VNEMPVVVIVAVGAAELLFLCIVAYAVSHPAPRRSSPTAVDGAELLRHLAITVVGGFAVFLSIVQLFHVWLAGQRGALRSALTGGGFLAFGVVAPAFLVLSWISNRVRRRGSPELRRDPHRPRQATDPSSTSSWTPSTKLSNDCSQANDGHRYQALPSAGRYTDVKSVPNPLA